MFLTVENGLFLSESDVMFMIVEVVKFLTGWEFLFLTLENVLFLTELDVMFLTEQDDDDDDYDDDSGRFQTVWDVMFHTVEDAMFLTKWYVMFLTVEDVVLLTVWDVMFLTVGGGMFLKACGLCSWHLKTLCQILCPWQWKVLFFRQEEILCSWHSKMLCSWLGRCYGCNSMICYSTFMIRWYMVHYMLWPENGGSWAPESGKFSVPDWKMLQFWQNELFCICSW
jgi:hypothetical protein